MSKIHHKLKKILTHSEGGSTFFSVLFETRICSLSISPDTTAFAISFVWYYFISQSFAFAIVAFFMFR